VLSGNLGEQASLASTAGRCRPVVVRTTRVRADNTKNGRRTGSPWAGNETREGAFCKNAGNGGGVFFVKKVENRGVFFS